MRSTHRLPEMSRWVIMEMGPRADGGKRLSFNRAHVKCVPVCCAPLIGTAVWIHTWCQRTETQRTQATTWTHSQRGDPPTSVDVWRLLTTTSSARQVPFWFMGLAFWANFDPPPLVAHGRVNPFITDVIGVGITSAFL